jgi:hypothetical protein
MTGVKRKNFTGDLKAKVALEAIRGIKTVNEIGQEYSGPSFQDSKLRWYPAKKGAGNDWSKAKEFYG